MGLQRRQLGRGTFCSPCRDCRSAPSGHSDWLAVQVHAGREFYSARHLHDRGYDVFLPAYDEHRRWSDRVTTIRRALFDGYLFCRAVNQAVALIVTAPAVIRVVGTSSGPLPIPLEEIEALKRIVDARLAVRPTPFVQAGQRVRVESGPLCGTHGVVLTVTGPRSLLVSITLLQRSVAVDLAPEWVVSE